MIAIFVISLFLLVLMIVLAVHSAYVYKKAMELNPEFKTLEQIRNQLAVANDRKSDLLNEIEGLQAKKAEAEEVIEKAESARLFLENNEAEIAKKKAIQEQEDREIKDLEEKIHEKNKAFTELSQQVTDLDREIGAKTLENENLDKDILSKQESVDSLDSRISQKNNELTNLENDISKRRNERDRLVSDCADLNNRKNELDEINKTLADLRVQKDQLEKAIEELEAKNKEYTDQKEKLDSILEDIKNKKAELDELNKNIGDAQEELGHIQGKTEGMRHSCEELASDEQRIKDNINTLNGRLDAIKAELEENKQNEDYLKKMESRIWDDLDRPIPMERTKPITKKLSEKELLSDFKKNLEDNNIVFSDRTINAFHTGLKAADASPLVVLSGISGTGKSLLPQLYAKAMGMNFLTVAVQPRWDSPQDMFGFFNYMQNKFKATELSRMLWQYDIYNNVEGEHSAKALYGTGDKLPMNIVLFDEMNLARVEYYFSDMLSKLEIRRNMSTPDFDEMRIPAEVEIEGGSISMKANARRLFVNSNTLFVGTMNEDETTQSLSDKVMDRSNILRFGKPEKLAVKPTVDKFMDSYSNENGYLTLGTWTEMVTESNLSSSKVEKIDSTMEKLNKVMNSIDRPFAYRVSNAVHNYVNAYPNANNSEEAFNNALADQIEMKVLPKLNGLDTTEKKNSSALQEILSIVNDVKDKELAETLENNIDRHEVFFKWRGIVR